MQIWQKQSREPWNDCGKVRVLYINEEGTSKARRVGLPENSSVCLRKMLRYLKINPFRKAQNRVCYKWN